MPHEHENPYLTALHELLKRHLHSLQRPLKELSDRLDALELGAAKESEVREEPTLFIQTNAGEKLWINYGQIATVLCLPPKLSSDSAFKHLPIQRAWPIVAIFLTQPWDTTILCQIRIKIEGALKGQADEEASNYKEVEAPPGIIKAADAVARYIISRKLKQLSPELKLDEIAGCSVAIGISTHKTN